MPATPLRTYDDLLTHLTYFCGANPGAEVRRDARSSVLNSMQTFSNAAVWSYFYQRGRIVTSEPYTTGTVAYDHTGGAYERLLTLTDGVWPAWAALGSVVINNVQYDVANRISDTQVTLTTNTNPGEDVSSTSYTLLRDTYPLPINFGSMGMMIFVGRSIVMEMEHPNTWLHRQRVFHGVSEPRVYCITGSPDFVTGMSLRLWPAPDGVYQLDCIYRRLPRPLKVDLVNTGTVAVSSGSATVNGSGTSSAWASRLVGSVFRVGVDPTRPVTAWSGENPPQAERIITAVNSSTQLTLDESVSVSASNAKYAISDPVDVEPNAMMTALLRCCEAEMAKARRMKDRMEIYKDYQQELILAREADSRYFKDEAAGSGGGVWPVPLRYMPRSAGE